MAEVDVTPATPACASAAGSTAIDFGTTDASIAYQHFPAWACRAGGARDYAEFITVQDSERYSLMPWAVRRVADIYRAECRQASPSSIIDATAHIGADTVQFASMFPAARITALECAPAAHAALQQNLANPRLVSAGRAGGAPVALLADCATWLSERESPVADLVYFDPPWTPAAGQQRLQLGDMQLHAAVAMALRLHAPLVVVKLPPGDPVDRFCACVAEALGAPVRSSSHNVAKPKGDLAYRLLFVRPSK